MKSTFRRIGFGVIIWAIPYALSIPLIPLQTSAPLSFKGIMAFIGSLTVAVITALYFRSITGKYLRESLIVALTWVVVNWGLDMLALLPFTDQTIPQYFMEIGIEYLGDAALVIAIGYSLEKKLHVNA